MTNWWKGAFCAAFSVLAVTGCGARETAPTQSVPQPVQQTAVAAETDTRVIRVRDEAGHKALFVLNDSPAADSLYRQLPITVKVENFSTNEKIFYPEALELGDTPQPDGSVGALAYYEPWGNVVMFFDQYRVNGDLYALGQVSDGLDDIPRMSGMITVEAVKE